MNDLASIVANVQTALGTPPARLLMHPKTLDALREVAPQYVAVSEQGAPLVCGVPAVTSEWMTLGLIYGLPKGEASP